MNVQSIKNLEDMKNCLESGEVDTFSKAIRLKCPRRSEKVRSDDVPAVAFPHGTPRQKNKK